MKKIANYFSMFLILLIIPFTLFAQNDYTLEEVGEFGGWDDAGISTSGMVQHDQYLYSLDNGALAIYDVDTDPTSPTLLKTITVPYGNKIFASDSWSTLAVTTEDGWTHGFIIYDISDPLNPIARPQAETPGPILDFIFNGGTFGDIIEENTDSLFVYYLGGSATAPYKVDAYPLPGNGKSLGQDPWAQILFVGYENGIRVYDTSNPYNYVQQFEQPLNSDLPQRIAPLTPIKKIFVGLNNSGHSSISCYSYDDPTDLQFVEQQTVSDNNELWDLKWEFSEAFLIVSLNLGGQLETYFWDNGTESFSLGPSLFMAAPADIITYFHFNPTSNSNKRENEIMGSGDDYIYVPNGSVGSVYVDGFEKTKIAKVIPPGGGGDQVTLSMNINPPEAVDHGCSTTPAPGQYQYDVGTELNLYAVPNEAEGWYFTGWTGSASGTDLIYHITMDANKNVTANFDLLELTVSGNIGSDFNCPDEITNNSRLLELPFLVCASDADDWLLSKISFRASGRGNDATDISSVKLYKSGTEVYSGNYPSDNGSIDVVFSPAITIGAGQCVPFKLTYDFDFDPLIYVNDAVKTFHVESFGVVAEPVNLTGGLIVGQTRNDSLIIARVTNSAGKYFTKIDDGVNSSTTASGDTCFVCCGDYTEFIQLTDTTKSIVLQSFYGASKTYIYPINPTDHAIYFSGHGEKVIDGFTFSGENDGTGVGFGGAQSGEVKNCIFYNLETGIGTRKVNNLNFHDNSFRKCNMSIHLTRSNNIEIYNNTCQDNNSDEPTISLYYSNNNFIHYNHIYEQSSDKTGMWIELKNSSHNKIDSHFALQNSKQMRLIQLERYSNANEISYNENFFVRIKNYSDSTNIHNNKLKMIKLYRSSSFTSIENNVISNSDLEGIDIDDNIFYKTPVYIANNSIFNNKNEGISSSGTPVTIYKNKIYNNGFGSDAGNGIYLSNVSFAGNSISKNDIYDNKKNGIYISDCLGMEISNNNITGHNWGDPSEHSTTAGILINFKSPQAMKRYYIINNYLAENCTGIEALFIDNGIDYDEMFLKGNIIENSSCENTGIHFSGISPTVTGNNINNNQGNGILCENNSVVSLSANNIFGNEEFGLNNSDANINLIADGNYWGTPDGPGDVDITGNVTVNNWLTEKVSIFASSIDDTIHVFAGENDSTRFFAQNLINPNDRVKITITDDKNWIEPINGVEKDLAEDSTGLAMEIQYAIPEDTNVGEISTVSFHVESVLKGTSSFDGIFYLTTYHQQVASISISPDSITTAYGDTVQFSAEALDQYSNRIELAPAWSANHETISNEGLFLTGSYEGEIEITATANAKDVSAKAYVYNTNQTLVLAKIAISPSSVTLEPEDGAFFETEGWNQFNYPYDFEKVWTATGGTISANGIYTAGDTPGNYTVSVTDSNGAATAAAEITITEPNGIDDGNVLPDKYALKQNYPNPFNPTTTIRYSIVNTSYVKLEVFNILGKRIMSKINKTMTPGIYEIVLDFSGFASGIYFYRLTVKDKFVNVKKLVLLK